MHLALVASLAPSIWPWSCTAAVDQVVRADNRLIVSKPQCGQSGRPGPEAPFLPMQDPRPCFGTAYRTTRWYSADACRRSGHKDSPLSNGRDEMGHKLPMCSSTDTRIRFVPGFSLVAGRRPLLPSPHYGRQCSGSRLRSLCWALHGPASYDSHMVVDRRTQPQVRQETIYSTA